MNKISAVYKIVNTITNDCYVGSSKNVFHRWAEHKCSFTWGRCPNNPLYLDMQKYGVDKFRFQILCPVEPEHLKEVEQELIEMIRPFYNSNRANGWDVDRYKSGHKKVIRKYQQSKKGKSASRKAVRKYYSKVCNYNGEILTLGNLATRFWRQGIEHPTLEAKKYLKKVSNN